MPDHTPDTNFRSPVAGPPTPGDPPVPLAVDYASAPPPRRRWRKTIQRGMVRLTRPMPMGFYLALSVAVPVVIMVIVFIVAFVASLFR